MKALNNNTCPSDDELSWAFSMEASDDIRAHVTLCPACAREWAALQQPGSLARALPTLPLSSTSRQRVRARLTAAAAAFVPPARRPPRWLIVAGPLLAAAACVALVWWSRAERVPGERALARVIPAAPTGPPAGPVPVKHRGRLRGHAGAGFLRVNAQPDEIVRLDEGKLTVEVQPLAKGERFRVITGDGEVEVHGTAFDIEARQDRLQGVRVLHGRVEVRMGSAPSVFLNAGERWTRPEEAAATSAPIAAPTKSARPQPARAPQAPQHAALAMPAETHRAPRTLPDLPANRAATPALAPSPASPSVMQPRPHVPAVTATPIVPAPVRAPHPAAPAAFDPAPGERDFRDAWATLTASSPAEAADGFARAVRSSQGTALEEDARFWHGVALARARRASPARQALGEFVTRYPGSPRQGEASAMLGWLLLDAGDVPGAERQFRAAERDPVAQVRHSAVKGLAVVASRKAGR